MEEELVRVLDANHYKGPNSAVIIRSFEVSNLRQLAGMTKVRIVQLIICRGRPFDFVVMNDSRTYADLVTVSVCAGAHPGEGVGRIDRAASARIASWPPRL